MIVKKPIGPVNIDGTLARLNVGRPVPAHVLAFWKEKGMLDDLKKIGAIGEPDKKTTDAGASSPATEKSRFGGISGSTGESKTGQSEDSK